MTRDTCFGGLGSGWVSFFFGGGVLSYYLFLGILSLPGPTLSITVDHCYMVNYLVIFMGKHVSDFNAFSGKLMGVFTCQFYGYVLCKKNGSNKLFAIEVLYELLKTPPFHYR